MSKISVAILNFNRPQYIYKDILPILEGYDSYIDEVIISHGKESTYFDDTFVKKKSIELEIKHLKHWELNSTYGLTLRFLTASQAKNKHILIIDDDIIPTKECVKFLKEKIEEDDQRIHGIYGRSLNENNEYSYTNYFGTVPIVLTRCLITSKEMCQYFLDNFRRYENDLIKTSKPYWNGEDILFSFLSIQNFGKLPRAYNLKHHNRFGNYLNLSESISLGDDNHINYRKKLTRYLVEEMNIGNMIKSGHRIVDWKTQLGYFVQNSSLLWFLGVIIALFIVLIVYKMT